MIRLRRWTLGVLLAFLALNAFAGGWYGIAGAPGVPLEWLEGTPFTSYRVPSLVLLVAVGGICSLAAVAVLARWKYGEAFAIVAAATLLGWIGVQVSMIGYVSWLQPAVSAAGFVILLLATGLARAEARTEAGRQA